MKIPTITWASWSSMVYSPLLIVLACVLVYYVRRKNYGARILAKTPLRDIVLQGYSPVRMVSKAVLFFIGISFIFCALLQPQWGTKEETVSQQGRDLFIALDISRSMLATDCAPNRLECAKEKIRALVGALSCERVGLILFSGSTFVQCPLTTDYAAFHMFLDGIDVETISSGTTALDQAILAALRVYESVPDRKHKLLVMFTDGEDFSQNMAAVQRQAVQAGMTLFTVGVGSPEGAPIPLFDKNGAQLGHQLDSNGAVVISRLNEAMLQTLARKTQGVYVRIKDDDSDVRSVVSRVHQFEKERLDDKKVSQLHEQYPWFLAISFVCLAVEWIL